jgi:hypothetical protein
MAVQLLEFVRVSVLIPQLQHLRLSKSYLIYFTQSSAKIFADIGKPDYKKYNTLRTFAFFFRVIGMKTFPTDTLKWTVPVIL